MMPERIAGYAKQMKEWGIPLVDKPEEMLGQIDGVLIESVQGSMHLGRAKPFLEAGLPCFIDKPFANSVEEALQIVELSTRHRAPVFSSSSLRYAPEVVNLKDGGKAGAIVGAHVHGPAGLHEGNPGLLHYGIHAVEMLFTLMGPGCERVACHHQDGGEVVIGHWREGRLGSLRGLRAGHSGSFGYVAYGDKGVASSAVGTQFIYRELLKQIVRFMQSKESPVSPRETVEIISFMVAARRSMARHGALETLQTGKE
jgi:predicted dehydrogenase